MYKQRQGGSTADYERRRQQWYDQQEEEPVYKQKSQEEIRREFEEWKKSKFEAYDAEKHTEFLKRRYYKMSKEQDFNTTSHFSHPNSR